MSPLLVGCALAAVLAGPSLYAQYLGGGIDGATAITRWAIVAGFSAVGTALIYMLIEGYQKEWAEKDAQEELAARQAAEAAEAAKAEKAEKAKKAKKAKKDGKAEPDEDESEENEETEEADSSQPA